MKTEVIKLSKDECGVVCSYARDYTALKCGYVICPHTLECDECVFYNNGEIPRENLLTQIVELK